MNPSFNKKEKYYALSGVNGCGVYNDYNLVKKAVSFLAKAHCVKCDSFDEAKEQALERFYDVQENYCWEVKIDEIQKVNWLYYRRKQEM